MFVAGKDIIKSFTFEEAFPLLSRDNSSQPKASNKLSNTPSASNQVVSSPPMEKLPTPPFGFTQKELSPYFGKFDISNIRKPSLRNSESSFVLRAESALTSPINISGWKVKMYRGEITIPEAIRDYDPFGYNNEEPILLSPRGEVRVDNGKSPVGRNFQLNTCTGYLNDIFPFKEKLPNQCPSIPRNEISVFSGACQTLLLSLGTCEAPTTEEINSIATDSACRTYVDKINFRSCYDTSRSRSDFYKNEWRVWMNREFPFDPQHDRVLLFDGSGLLVDEYAY